LFPPAFVFGPHVDILLQDSALAPNPLATAQLDLLSKLIGRNETKQGTPEFRLNLFNTDEEEEYVFNRVKKSVYFL